MFRSGCTSMLCIIQRYRTPINRGYCWSDTQYAINVYLLRITEGQKLILQKSLLFFLTSSTYVIVNLNSPQQSLYTIIAMGCCQKCKKNQGKYSITLSLSFLALFVFLISIDFSLLHQSMSQEGRHQTNTKKYCL